MKDCLCVKEGKNRQVPLSLMSCQTNGTSIWKQNIRKRLIQSFVFILVLKETKSLIKCLFDVDYESDRENARYTQFYKLLIVK